MANTKIGVRVDEDLWAEFRQFVQDNHNRTRGVLSNELENAIEEYMTQERTTDQLTRIEEDVSRLKAIVAEAEGDGGTTPAENDVHTHTPNVSSGEKPPANAPRHEKVEYIADSLFEPESEQVAPPMIKREIEIEYGFGDRTVEKLVPLVVDNLASREGTVRHPNNEMIVGWGEVAEDLLEYREDTGGDTDE